MKSFVPSQFRLPALAALMGLAILTARSNSQAEPVSSCQAAFSHSATYPGLDPTAVLANKRLQALSKLGELIEKQAATAMPDIADPLLDDEFNFALDEHFDGLEDSEVDTPHRPHKLEIREGLGYFSFGLHTGSESSIAKALMNAVKTGAIAKIDTGDIVGAKVLTLLLNVKKIVPTNSTLMIEGRLNPELVIENMRLDMGHEKNRKTSEGKYNYDFYSIAEINMIRRSFQELGIYKACRELYGSSLENCRTMRFEMNASDPKSIRWRKI